MLIGAWANAAVGRSRDVTALWRQSGEHGAKISDHRKSVESVAASDPLRHTIRYHDFFLVAPFLFSQKNPLQPQRGQHSIRILVQHRL